MKNYIIRQYKKENKAIWNTFIGNAKNATFLFNRDFMDYHSDRFEDYSLLVFDESEKLVAVLPANRFGDSLHSHQGLTYGGLVFGYKVRLSEIVKVTESLLKHLHENGISKLYVKMLPEIYSEQFADEFEYCLFICKSIVYRKDVLSVIDLKSSYSIANNRLEGIRKGLKNNLTIKKDDSDFKLFWKNILIPNLLNKHNSKPVHSLDELLKLKNYFPKNIHFFTVHGSNSIEAGCVVFESKRVAHMQYISGNEVKSKTGSLDFLHHYLITDYFKNKDFFDFGSSNENNGLNINSGLLYWKETFGARTQVHDYYEVNTENHKLLNDVLI